MRVTPNAFQAGPNASLEQSAKVGHPVQAIQQRLVQSTFQTKVANRAMLFGPASAIHLHMDRQILSCHQRHGCLPSARPALECALGLSDTLEVGGQSFHPR